VSQVFFDVIYDDRTDTLLVCTDTPDFHLRVSTDRGATFAPEVNPAGMAFYSDWAIGNGTIYVAGASGGSDNLILIPAASPGTSSTVAGLPYTNQSSQRALGADPVGNAYIATLLDSGAVQLDRLPFGTTTFAAPRTIAGERHLPGHHRAADLDGRRDDLHVGRRRRVRDDPDVLIGEVCHQTSPRRGQVPGEPPLRDAPLWGAWCFSVGWC
jgi:hypothetical protein